MTIDTEVCALQKFRMFSEVEPGKLKLLAMVSDRVTFQPNEVIYHQGDASDAVYIVLNGEFKVSLDTKSGEVAFAEHIRGSLLGEAGVLCGMSRGVTITAQTELTALRVERDTFLGLIKESPAFNLAVMKELGRQIMDLNVICADLVRRMPKDLAPADVASIRAW
ncbi:Crp/Fnr family transcriptional regulator [Flaviflagellibacter deserti]|jgi:CRP-like cAMP-binding protein|uniref:Crp/Fnr family transcriptional regulator n=1 Tax=Flaviflagellibacter deserti TaxID=2267266 RepID=A0ABV9Z0J3_9HYPH